MSPPIENAVFSFLFVCFPDIFIFYAHGERCLVFPAPIYIYIKISPPNGKRVFFVLQFLLACVCVVRARTRGWVHVCVHACVRACVHVFVCVRVCMRRVCVYVAGHHPSTPDSTR